MKIREVSIMDILDAREMRVERQRKLLEKHQAPLISFTLNIAGPIKHDAWIERAFHEGVWRIESVLKGRRIEVLDCVSEIAFTGCEQLWAVAAEAESLKAWMQMIEEQDDLGRLFDIDIILLDGSKLSRLSERRCLICGGPVRACARSRAHSAEEIFCCTQEIIQQFFRTQFVKKIGMIAEKALLYEVVTTPKPGLVDCENSGAHSDMDRFTFVSSACALRPHFESCVQLGLDGSNRDAEVLFESLRHYGLLAESEMFAATGGVNTHKGALFSLSLLCCAAGMGFGSAFSMEDLLRRAAELARTSLKDFEKVDVESARTGGELQFAQSGLTGVRGEAASGFRSVREIALPALERALGAGKSFNDAGLEALTALMSVVLDSNILRRAGEEGQRAVWREIQNLPSISRQEMDALNERFVQMNVSPGGSADLLAIAYFLKMMQEEWT